jgi:hypothetical protein
MHAFPISPYQLLSFRAICLIFACRAILLVRMVSPDQDRRAMHDTECIRKSFKYCICTTSFRTGLVDALKKNASLRSVIPCVKYIIVM